MDMDLQSISSMNSTKKSEISSIPKSDISSIKKAPKFKRFPGNG